MKAFLRYFFIIGSVLIVLILIWASVDKLIKLNMVENNPDLFATASIEYFYKDHIMLGYIHIVPGLLFLVLGAYQLIPYFRRKNYRLHRFLGKVFLILAAIIFITAIILAIFYPFGDLLETLTTVIFGGYLLYSTFMAYFSARAKKFKEHRNWVLRIYFIAIAVSTIRGILGLLAAVYDIPIKVSFGTAFLIAFILHYILVEVYIRYLTKPVRY